MGELSEKGIIKKQKMARFAIQNKPYKNRVQMLKVRYLTSSNVMEMDLKLIKEAMDLTLIKGAMDLKLKIKRAMDLTLRKGAMDMLVVVECEGEEGK